MSCSLGNVCRLVLSACAHQQLHGWTQLTRHGFDMFSSLLRNGGYMLVKTNIEGDLIETLTDYCGTA